MRWRSPTALYETQWEHADPVGGGPALRIGAIVRLVADRRVGRVLAYQRVRDTFRYTVVVDGESHHLFEDNLEEVEGDPRSPEFWVTQPPGNASQIALTLAWMKLRQPLTDVLYSIAAAPAA